MSDFRRCLLKISGEALAGDAGHGIDNLIINRVAKEIAGSVKMGAQIALVIGGGNFARGVSASAGGMNRAAADSIGMLATVMNAIAMQDALEKHGLDAEIMSAIGMEPLCQIFDRRKAMQILGAGKVVIFAAGTGNPFFTTDTAAILRAIESGCDVMMKATKVDGIYSADPFKDKSAFKFNDITYEEILKRNLAVMDTTAVTLARENKLPVCVFKLAEGNLAQVLNQSGGVGTFVHE
ncbi:MAG: UMP kinase [Fibromonadaceae bacterium]|jgi:uridylate kinase|nr:UMP kinase [Fibromonadaceae bacterium]